MNFNRSLLIVVTLMTASLNAENFPAKFEGPYIKVVARTAKCGAFTIKPLKPAIKLESYLYEPKGSRLGTDGIIGAIEELEGPGRTIRYDSAGLHTQAHYRIYCKEKNSKYPSGQPVVCEKAVKIDTLSHNDKCQSDSALGVGISATEGYRNLNMNKAAL